MPIIIVIFDTPPPPFVYVIPLPSSIVYLFGWGGLSWNVHQKKIDMFHVERFVKKYNVPRHFTWCR